MRNFLIASIALIGMTGAAFAGEGNGEPFPGPSAEVTTRTDNAVYVHQNQDPYQYRAASGATSVTAAMVGHKDQDPYQLRMAGQVVRTGAPLTGPQSGTATASTTRGLANPAAAAQGSHG